MTTDIPDLIAGALGVSRGTAYDMMREALAEQPAQQEPLTEQEFEALHWKAKGYVVTGMMDVVRIVEAHYGITKGNT